MDKIGNLLVTIKNAGNASKESVQVPYSKYRHAVATFLQKEGYVTTVDKKLGKGGHPILEIGISYNEGKPRITQVKRVSKPSRKLYASVKEIRSVRNGYGLLALSTPKGILSGKEARKQNVGGEMLFKLW